MNKDEFIKKVSQLSYPTSSYSSDKWSEEKGFSECKEMVTNLALELDIDGLSPRTFALFRDAMNDMTNCYEQLFALQRELQDKNMQVLELQREISNLYKQKGKKETV